MLVYPGAASRFDLYEDDGQTTAYLRGAYALTVITARREADRTIVEVAEPSGDPGVLPASRRYTLQIRRELPSRVEVAGVADFPRLDGPSHREPGWWHDGSHFLFVRLPERAGRIVLVD